MTATVRGGKAGARRRLLRSALGDVLRRIRLDQGRTLAEVSARAGMSMPYLSEVERGRKEASSEVLAALCDALEVPLSRVLGEVGRDLAADAAERARLLRADAAEESRREVVELLKQVERAHAAAGSMSGTFAGSGFRSPAGPIGRSGDVMLVAA
jgi:transcriptional regulator with XRE-family HTH domain